MISRWPADWKRPAPGQAIRPLLLIRAPALEALEDFLGKNLDYDLYSEHFADDLAEILQDNCPEDQVNSAQTLARECSDADDKVNIAPCARREGSKP